MVLRRLGFAATLASGALMLATAVHGMSGVDERLELAAASDAARSRTVLVRDLRHGCEDPPPRREPRLRV